MSRAEINQYRCFMGHFGAGFFNLLDFPALGITMLRDPFERAISALHYARKMYRASGMPTLSDERKRFLIERAIIEPSEISSFNATMAGTLERGDFIEMLSNPWLARVIENRQTLYLGYDVDISTTSLSPESMLNWSRYTDDNLEFFFVNKLASGFDVSSVITQAEKRLDQMDVVGIAEHFGQSVGLLCRCLGLKVPQSLPRENIAPERNSLRSSTYRESGLPHDVVRRIDELTEIDRHIYEYAFSIFIKKSRQLNRRLFFFG